jgi:hypothetical protein
MRRALLLWLLLFGAYAATLGLDSFRDSGYGGDEPHYLLEAESLAHDGNVDVTDEYAERAYSDFHPYELEPNGTPTDGRLNEPYGIGFALFILPAYALGGAHAVELFLAAVAALALALAYRLALRVVPDPWAIGAAAATGLSAPLLAYGSAVYPELSAAAALAGAALLALRLGERPSPRSAFACFALLGALPWLGVAFVPAGIVIGVFAARALWRARRRTLGVLSIELALFSVALYVGFNEALYAGPTPYSADPGDAPGDDLLRWAPVFALAFVGLWFLWRSRRDRLARAVPELHRVEMAAGLCTAVLGAQLAVAAVLAPSVAGFWLPARHLLPALPLATPLVAWGLRRTPQAGYPLIALSLVASAWLYVDVRWAGGALVGPD